MLRVLSCLGLLAAWCCEAAAQIHWTAASLHPAGADSSALGAVYGQHQGGAVGVTHLSYAALWSGPASGWTNMPPQSSNASITGMWENQRVGLVDGRAMLWLGLSPINLQPSGYLSQVHAVRAGQQVGTATEPGMPYRAALWYSTAPSWVDLHPGGAVHSSEAGATDGAHQGGWVRHGPASNPGPSQAAMWSGTPGTYRSLHPSGATASSILGMAPGQQVGWVETVAFGRQGAVWRGSAQDWELYGVPGLGASEIVATTGAEQVGAVYPNLIPRATIWFNTAGSYFDLHQFLPAAYIDSKATCVYREGNTIYVGGWGVTAERREAILWTGIIPAPGAAAPLLAFAAFALRRRR